MNSPFPSLDCAFAVTASDTVDIKSDAGNVEGVAGVFLQNVAASATCRVLPAGQHPANGTPVPVTIYLVQGVVHPLKVKRVYATTPTVPAGLIAMYSKARH